MSEKTVFVLWNWDGPFGVFTTLEQAQYSAPVLYRGHKSRGRLMLWKLDEELSEDYSKTDDTLIVRVWQLGSSEWFISECYVDGKLDTDVADMHNIT